MAASAGGSTPPKMREFMAYVQNAFYDATGWTHDNSYPSLNATADGTLPSLLIGLPLYPPRLVFPARRSN